MEEEEEEEAEHKDEYEAADEDSGGGPIITPVRVYFGGGTGIGLSIRSLRRFFRAFKRFFI